MNELQNKIFCGGNLEVVSSWPSNFVSAIVTDPPYGLGFMGKDWDTFKSDFIKKESNAWQENKKSKIKSPDGYTKGRSRTPSTLAGLYDQSLSGHIRFQQQFTVWAKAMLRITKPGGFLLCFGGTRTYHRLACAIEDAGWEIRDCMMWLYGSGFPKSHNISKAIDKAAGAKRKVIGTRPAPGYARSEVEHGKQNRTKYEFEQTSDEASTPLAEVWQGYGTALKPAWEPIIVAMKPLDGTFAHNAEAHGVAGLNIDAARIGTEQIKTHGKRNGTGNSLGLSKYTSPENYSGGTHQGRWPANLILDEEAGAMLDEQTGTKKSGFMAAGTKRLMSDNPNKNTYGEFKPDTVRNDTYGDSGGASRFFYCAKTSRRERNMGMEDCEDKLRGPTGEGLDNTLKGPTNMLRKDKPTVSKNNHPTVKPLALMKYLCTLLKMPGSDQIILDPFLGSGTTGIACKELGINFIGIEKEREYCEIAVKRIAAVEGQEITLETTLSVTKNVDVQATKNLAGGSRRPSNESLPHVSESRQSIINATSAALRRNQK